jgi:hypothetical protein
MTKWKRRLCFVLASICIGYLFWLVALYLTTYAPVLDAVDDVRRHGASNGYQMEGYLGDISIEPDSIGSCEVVFDFPDATDDPSKRQLKIRLRRSWAFAPWEVVEINERVR